MAESATDGTGTGHARRCRRTKEEIAGIRTAILELLADHHSMTARQIFYRLTSRGLIGKTEGEYERTVVRLLIRMRRSGELPFGWIADDTGLQREPMARAGLADAAGGAASASCGAPQDAKAPYIETWLEHESIGGVLLPLTSKFGVPLMVTRGHPSLSFLHAAAEAIRGQGRPAVIYYLGDHDRRGVDALRRIPRGIRDIASDVDLTFHRLAVTPAQIESLGLQTCPTKDH
jgi:hypothetical protein